MRSVRCLDECGIISERCNGNKESRPSTYEFCGQTDCVTGQLKYTLQCNTVGDNMV